MQLQDRIDNLTLQLSILTDKNTISDKIREALIEAKRDGLMAALGCCNFLDNTNMMIAASIQSEIDNLEKLSKLSQPES